LLCRHPHPRPKIDVISGLLLLDKPIGLSSNAALQRVRRKLGGIRAGHSGSLDPLASGMLPICIGEATKVAGELLAGRKCYRFELSLGERRDTGDAEGAVVETCAVPDLDPARVAVVLRAMLGTQQQVPPMYSALKRDGQPLYKLARRGITVERAAREIHIETLELLGQAPGRLMLRTLCSKGTYIRTLAEDLARALGSCGYVSLLRREYVEPFADQPMVTLSDFEDGIGVPPLLPADSAIPQLPAMMLTATQTTAIRHGQTVSWGGEATAAGAVRLYDDRQQFFGLGTIDVAGTLSGRRLFATGAQPGSRHRLSSNV